MRDTNGGNMKLTIRKSDSLGDWYVIERAEHDGRSWLQPVGENSMAFMHSARFSDADVEGTAEEMQAIAAAILHRSAAKFGRCAVDATLGQIVAFWSPRNSTDDGHCTLEEADDLASQIMALLAEATHA